MNSAGTSVFINHVTRYSDFLLAALVVMIVGMMIIPLPTPLIDILLALNISIGVTILLVALYISSPIRIAVFPSILLLTTLFRLALNISTTRLILLQADAGDVIRAFGEFVVEGNMVVGAIVFLILTLVNFIVISKGSERVAEVAARFTLDAMPGKQMAIDADLRSGAFDLEEAKFRRREIERESQLFGSMDGAMKFVKGDAIAGIIITCINIAGGIIIGTMMRGMSAVEAIKLYGILTIGDGLVSQLPALIISTAAGLIVTRVAPERSGDHLGKDIGSQILAYPRAIAVTSGLLVLLGLVPGLPFLPFCALAVMTGTVSMALYRSGQTEVTGIRDGLDSAARETGEVQNFALPVPVTLTAGVEVTRLLAPGAENSEFVDEWVPQIRDQLYMDLGVRIPGVRVQGNSLELQPLDYMISIEDACVTVARLDPEAVYVESSVDALTSLLIPAEKVPEPGSHAPLALVPKARIEAVQTAGYPHWHGVALIARHLQNVLKKYAHRFVGIQETRWLCADLEQYYPDIVREVVPDIISYARLSEILRRLISEHISIRNLRRILDLLGQFASEEHDDLILTERVRIGLSHEITALHSRGSGAISAYILDPELEELIRQAVQFDGSERYLALEPATLDGIIAEFDRELGRRESGVRLVLTADYRIRYILARFLSHTFPGSRVISFQELEPGTQIMPQGRISAPSA